MSQQDPHELNPYLALVRRLLMLSVIELGISVADSLLVATQVVDWQTTLRYMQVLWLALGAINVFLLVGFARTRVARAGHGWAITAVTSAAVVLFIQLINLPHNALSVVFGHPMYVGTKVMSVAMWFAFVALAHERGQKTAGRTAAMMTLLVAQLLVYVCQHFFVRALFHSTSTIYFLSCANTLLYVAKGGLLIELLFRIGGDTSAWPSEQKPRST